MDARQSGPGGRPAVGAAQGASGEAAESSAAVTAPLCELSAERNRGCCCPEPSFRGWGREAPRGEGASGAPTQPAGKRARALIHAWGDRSPQGGTVIYPRPQPEGDGSASSDSDPRRSRAESRLPTRSRGEAFGRDGAAGVPGQVRGQVRGQVCGPSATQVQGQSSGLAGNRPGHTAPGPESGSCCPVTLRSCNPHGQLPESPVCACVCERAGRGTRVPGGGLATHSSLLRHQHSSWLQLMKDPRLGWSPRASLPTLGRVAGRFLTLIRRPRRPSGRLAGMLCLGLAVFPDSCPLGAHLGGFQPRGSLCSLAPHLLGGVRREKGWLWLKQGGFLQAWPLLLHFFSFQNLKGAA